MIYEVKIMTPEGNIKQIIPSEILTKQVWINEQLNPISTQELLAQAEKEQAKKQAKLRKCIYCSTMFIPRTEGKLYCTNRKCSCASYRERKKAPLLNKLCPICKKPFKGTASRKYCNNPCQHPNMGPRK